MQAHLILVGLGAIPAILFGCWCWSSAHSPANPEGGNASAGEASALVGCWELRSYSRWTGDSAAHPYGEKPEGVLMYDAEGNMSVQFMQLGRPKFAIDDRRKGTTAELKAAFEGYFAYFGRYTVDLKEGTVVHIVEGSMLPNWTGKKLKRFFTLSGKKLTLTTPTEMVGDKEAKTVLVWEKRG